MPGQTEKSIRSIRAVGTAIGLLIALAAAWCGIHSRAPTAPTKKREVIPFATVKPVLDSRSKGRFDLVIATNVFVYYDAFEQALAVQNISTLLKPGAFLLTNNWLPHLPQIPMHALGYTSVRYGEGAEEGDNIFWWKRE